MLPDSIHPEVSPYGERLTVGRDGRIFAKEGDSIGRMLIDGFRLDNPRLEAFRRERIKEWRNADSKATGRRTTCGRFELPVEMPDLRLQRPDDNHYPDGVYHTYRIRYPGAK